jgi:hypothetical protein
MSRKAANRWQPCLRKTKISEIKVVRIEKEILPPASMIITLQQPQELIIFGVVFEQPCRPPKENLKTQHAALRHPVSEVINPHQTRRIERLVFDVYSA